MGRYISAAEVIARHPKVVSTGVDNVESHFLLYAESDLDAKLLPHFAAEDITSNNLTVKDLAIELTYLRIGNLKVSDHDKRMEALKKRVQSIIDGEAFMITTSGTQIKTVGGAVFSTTETFHPTFGVGDIEDFIVDSSQQLSEENERRF